MGRNGRSAKMYGKVVEKDYSERPGWKGSTSQKPKAEKMKPAVVEDDDDEPALEPTSRIPIELQQLLLSIFKDVFPETLDSEILQPLLQEVKRHLYDRDFNQAFGKSEYLEAYSVRWSPSRALCYQSILVDIEEHLTRVISVSDNSKPAGEELDLRSVGKPNLKVACIGGGGAEVVAFGGFVRYLLDAQHQVPKDNITQQLEELSMGDDVMKIDLLLVDVAQWEFVTQKLHAGLISTPTISKYANASAKKANTALLTPDSMSTAFRCDDVLELSPKVLLEQYGSGPMLVTLLFTLNELYTASIGKTTAFLLNLTAALEPGSLLLVVDSPGSYSETTVGTEAKKYPMQWLLNHTLLGSEKDTSKSEVSWVRELSEASKWFRVPESLRYPIPLENMRYQMHLYRRV